MQPTYPYLNIGFNILFLNIIFNINIRLIILSLGDDVFVDCKIPIVTL